jgi:hypothetical protein
MIILMQGKIINFSSSCNNILYKTYGYIVHFLTQRKIEGTNYDESYIDWFIYMDCIIQTSSPWILPNHLFLESKFIISHPPNTFAIEVQHVPIPHLDSPCMFQIIFH